MPDAFGATTPEEEEELLMRAYYQAQNAPVGQRYETFQSVAPPVEQYVPGPRADLVQPDPGMGGAGGAAPMSRSVVPSGQGMVGQAAPVVAPAPAPMAPPPGSAAAGAARGPITIQEVDVAPRPGLPGTMPGQGIGRPAKPGAISKAQLDAQLRKDAGIGDEGSLIPHKVGLTVKPMLPGEQQQLNEAEDEQFRAQIEQGEAQIQAGQDIADRVVEQADEQDRIDARFAEREMERQSMLRDRETKLGEMADAVVNEPIESPNFLGTEIGEQILNGLTVFLGAVGAAGGGPNYAWQKLQKKMELGIAAQKDRRELKLGRLKTEAALIDMARERFKSEALVDAAMREAAYRKLGAELERFKEFAKTPERKAALDAMIAQNNRQMSLNAIETRKAMDLDVLNERAIKARAAGGGDTLAQQVKRRELEARGVKADREIEGKTGEDAKAIRKAQADYEATIASVNRYEQSNVGVGVTSSKAEKERARQERESSARTYQNEFLGKSEQDAKSADAAFPEGGTLTRKESVQQAAQAARQRAKDKRDAAIKAAGGNPGGFTPQGGK